MRLQACGCAVIIVSAFGGFSASAIARDKVSIYDLTACLEYDASENKISNACNEPVEAYWRDTRGGRNQVTIRAHSYYQGGAEVSEFFGCPIRSDYSFDWEAERCYMWQ